MAELERSSDMRGRKAREELIKQDFDKVFSTPEGKRVLGNIFYLSRHNEMSLDLKSFVNTAFMEGIRFVGVQLETMLGVANTYKCLQAFEVFEARFDEKGDSKYGE